MTAPATTVTLDLPGATAVTAFTNNATIRRGRQSPVFEDIDAGSASAQFNNEARTFDPLYSSSPYFGEVVPGRQATIVSGGVTIFDGRTKDWNLDYEVSGRSVAVVSMVDGLVKLARTTFDEWTTTNGDLPGDRYAVVMARPEVGYTGSTSFDTGASYLCSDFVSWGSNVLNYCQLIARTDFGLFYVDRTGVLTFKDRLSFINATAAATFGTGGIGFSAITTSYGDELLYNRVAVERVDGEPQAADDSTSISDYDGTYTLALSGLLLQDDTQALDLATYLVSVFKDPLYRVESLTIDVHGLSGGNQTTVLGLDIGSVVTVTFTPNRVGTALTRTCVVEGVQHSIMPAVHVMTLTLNDSGPFQTGHFYTVEDATYGTVGAGGALDYPIAF